MSRHQTSLSRQMWLGMFAANIMLLVLLGWSFLYLEPGTSSYVIGQVSAVTLGICLVGTAAALYSGWEPF